jgi:SAM-dependent MidA family methyltransferase
MTTLESLTTELSQRLARAIGAAGGQIGFDEFMALALYTPGLGYYANDLRKLGLMPGSGSDFVTAPEITPLFGQTLARQIGQAMAVTQTAELWEFGAGSGALAAQLLGELGDQVKRYTIIDISGALRARQQETLKAFGDQVRWVSELPRQMNGVVLGNEVLDAMPVKLLARKSGVWHERCVSWDANTQKFEWLDVATSLRPPVEIDGEHDYLCEIHAQAQAFVRTLADTLQKGALFLIDYGFPEGEYYHVQRISGTVMCHRAHQADADPLSDVGLKDITAHVDFTGIALAAQDAGFNVLGYCTQARFLMNCGLLPLMDQASLSERVNAQKLIMEHEMGELFKVIALGKGEVWEPMGFTQGDRTHTL